MLKNGTEAPAGRSRSPGLKARCSSLFGAIVAACLCAGFASSAAILPAEKILPEDTLVLLTTPDSAKLGEICRRSPEYLLWNDPAMKPFKDKFVSKWNEELVKPLERDLGVKFDDYTCLLQGQLTFALIQNGWQGGEDQSLGLLLLLDAKDKSSQLKKNLAELRKKWVDGGKVLKTEKIRNIEFTILPMSSNDIPKTLGKFFSPPSEVQELGDEKTAKKPAPKGELVMGQVESMLILGNSTKVVEKVVTRLTGGTIPTLGESAAYQANHLALFRDAPAYGWVNAKTFIDIWTRKAAEKKENPDAPNPFDFPWDKVVGAVGLSGLKTVAASFQDSNEGGLLQFFAGVPAANRQGVFKILAGEAKDSAPPPFVPANAVKFQRWRMDGQKTWTTIQKALNDVNPQWLSAIDFMLESANTAAKEKDPSFDIKKNLIGNLGDDMITYEKAPRGATMADLQSPPSLFLLGSPNAEQLAGALKCTLGFMNQQGGSPTEREFLGRKIFSMPLPSLALPRGETSKAGASKALYYASSGGYVAMSADVSMLEEYLRSSENQQKALRETQGLTDAAQKVTGPGTSLFGYENQSETMRAAFEMLRKDSASGNPLTAALASILPGALGAANSEQDFKDWVDFSLLPAFDKVSKYFYFSVYGGSANLDGLTLKMFSPVPPGMKSGETPKR